MGSGGFVFWARATGKLMYGLRSHPKVGKLYKANRQIKCRLEKQDADDGWVYTTPWEIEKDTVLLILSIGKVPNSNHDGYRCLHEEEVIWLSTFDNHRLEKIET